MGTVPVGNSYIATVDDEDLHLVIGRKWHIDLRSGRPRPYTRINRNRHPIGMGRLIWTAIHGEIPRGKYTDHINLDPLDNRRCNLRLATPQQNMWNRGRTCRNTTGFKCVYPSRTPGKFVCHFYQNWKHIWLGTYSTAEAAFAAYCAYVQQHRGEFGRVG